MTAHAGLPVPSDLFLYDQFSAWAEKLEDYFTQVLEQSPGVETMTAEEIIEMCQWRLARTTELLCTGRQLAQEMIRRNGPVPDADLLLAAEFDRVFDLAGDPAEYQPDEDGDQ